MCRCSLPLRLWDWDGEGGTQQRLQLLQEFERVSLVYYINKEVCALLWRSEGVNEFSEKYLIIVLGL